jgi:hypothetical protein
MAADAACTWTDLAEFVCGKGSVGQSPISRKLQSVFQDMLLGDELSDTGVVSFKLGLDA